jgi:hypothetical protein
MLVATPEEQKVLDELAKAEAEGKDPFGDEDEDVQVLEAEVDTDDLDDDAQGEPAKEPETAEQQEPVAEQQLQEPTGYKAEVPQDYRDKRGELLKAKAEAMKKLMDGESSAEEFATEDARISDALEELTAQRIRAETLIEANQQLQAQTQQKSLQRLIAQTKDQVDYLADPKAQKQFDTALQMIGADPDNAGKDYADLIADAHKMVCALRGIPLTKGEQVAQAVQQQATRKTQEKPPVTLRNMPSASTPNANGDMLDQMGRLTGPAYEEAFNRLTPAQRKALLDEE